VQHLGLVGVLCHAIHFSLQLLGSDWPMPVSLQRLRVAQVILDFAFDLRLRHHRIKRWFRITTLVWPNPITPVNVLNHALVNDALRKR
jgi:hypothetical protein